MLALTHLNQNIWWYFARAGGLVAWGLLATTVFWGLIYAGRLTRKVPPPAWNLDLHRFLGGLALIFVAIHVAALTADRYVDFGLSQVLVPFASHWRPGAVAWGIVALYLVVAVELTSLAMRWLPRRLWRQIHLLSFVLFAFSTVHAIETGTDVANPLVRALGVGLLVTATVVAVLRIVQAQRRAATRRPGVAGVGNLDRSASSPRAAQLAAARAARAPATASAAAAAAPAGTAATAAPAAPSGLHTLPTDRDIPVARRAVPVATSPAVLVPTSRVERRSPALASTTRNEGRVPAASARPVPGVWTALGQPFAPASRPQGTDYVRAARPPWPPPSTAPSRHPVPPAVRDRLAGTAASGRPTSSSPPGSGSWAKVSEAPRRPKVPRFAEPPPPVERKKGGARQ